MMGGRGIGRAYVVLAGILAVLGPSYGAHAATGTVMPSPRFYCLDANGTIIPSGRLFTYDAGTTTKRNTFTTADLSVANANPTVCSASGQLTAFLTPGVSYKFVLAAAGIDDPPSSPLWTVDNVSSVPFSTLDLDITGTAGEALSAGDSVYLSDGSGGTTAGRWYKTDADAVASSTTAQALGFSVSAISSAASGSIRIQGKITGLAGLAAGSVYYVSATAGAITSTAPTNQRAVGVADSGTTLVISSALVAAPASATQAGIVSLGTQTLGTGTKTFTEAPLFTAGTGSGTATTSGVINVNTTTVGNVGAGEDDLMTYTLPANTLTANGKGLRVTFMGNMANNANAKTLKIKFGTTTVLTRVLTASVAGAWTVTLVVLRTGASSEALSAAIIEGGTGANALAQVESGTASDSTASTIVIKATAEATTTNDITQYGLIVEVIN